jgi:hypothetical protein
VYLPASLSISLSVCVCSRECVNRYHYQWIMKYCTFQNHNQPMFRLQPSFELQSTMQKHTHTHTHNQSIKTNKCNFHVQDIIDYFYTHHNPQFVQTIKYHRHVQRHKHLYHISQWPCGLGGGWGVIFYINEHTMVMHFTFLITNSYYASTISVSWQTQNKTKSLPNAHKHWHRHTIHTYMCTHINIRTCILTSAHTHTFPHA